MLEKLKVALLFDRGNDWIRSHATQIVETELLASRYHFDFIYDPNELQNYDVVFILGFTRIIPLSVLASNGINLVVHESDLPNGKGFSPVQWQVLEGINRVPVCLIEASEEVDSGDILGRTCIELNGSELFDEIRNKQAAATVELMEGFLRKFPEMTRTKQNGTSTFYKRRTEADDKLDVDKTIRDQFNHLRIGDNERYPLYFVIDGEKYYVQITKAQC